MAWHGMAWHGKKTHHLSRFCNHTAKLMSDRCWSAGISVSDGVSISAAATLRLTSTDGATVCSGAVSFSSASDIQLHSNVTQTSAGSTLTINSDTDSGGQGDLTVQNGKAIQGYGDESASISIISNDVILDGWIELQSTPMQLSASGVRICVGKERVDGGTWNIAG
eukprot:2624351-Rhodomonas_salina.3